MVTADFLLVHAGELLTLAGPAAPRKGRLSDELGMILDGSLASMEGRIVWVGPSDQVPDNVQLTPHATEFDVQSKVITPGLVDCHTHPVFSGTRQAEFAMRARGEDYEEIARKGGGILNSVERTRQASTEDLFNTALRHAGTMLAHGTTTLEAKSGYGLDLDTELRSLEVLRDLPGFTGQTVVPTYLGAHEVPAEYRDEPDAYVELIVERVMPLVAEKGLARFVDVFCERGVFSVAQSRRILQRAEELGLGLKIHADEFSDTGASALAVELGATSADHLLASGDQSVSLLAESDTVATLLPGTALFLAKPFPDGRRFMDRGAAVAIATDFNPGSCFCESMPFIINLAVCECGLNVEQALVSATINGAFAVGLGDAKGSLEVGKDCDLLVWNADDYRSIAYHLAVDDIDRVYISAKQAVSRERKVKSVSLEDDR
ncbi:imidazolonepropionase [Candidatus Fermentibacteria bacterium]|nr:imidazolonepropionase [Candidatus Fermentibacteria bacterium]